MADQEEGRLPPPPRSSGAFQEDAFQADAFQTVPSSPATSSQPATPYANVTSGDQTVTPYSGSLVVEGGKPTPEVTAYKLDLEGGQSEVKWSILEED